jgi:hypothetical protein
MDPVTLSAVMKFVVPGALAVGGAWGGAKAALNGTRNRVKHLETEFANHKQTTDLKHTDTIDRLARIETKLDLFMQHPEK